MPGGCSGLTPHHGATKATMLVRLNVQTVGQGLLAQQGRDSRSPSWPSGTPSHQSSSRASPLGRGPPARRRARWRESAREAGAAAWLRWSQMKHEDGKAQTYVALEGGDTLTWLISRMLVSHRPGRDDEVADTGYAVAYSLAVVATHEYFYLRARGGVRVKRPRSLCGVRPGSLPSAFPATHLVPTTTYSEPQPSLFSVVCLLLAAPFARTNDGQSIGRDRQRVAFPASAVVVPSSRHSLCSATTADNSHDFCLGSHQDGHPARLPCVRLLVPLEFVDLPFFACQTEDFLVPRLEASRSSEPAREGRYHLGGRSFAASRHLEASRMSGQGG